MARVALIDCGIAGMPTAATCAFASDGRPLAPVPARAPHGTTLAGIVRHLAPATALLDAQVFVETPGTTAVAVAAGIDWAVAEGAEIINMSMGLTQDRTVLAEACTRAATAGCILVASSPAQGGPVYPAAYPRVIRVCGDARCAPGEFSALDTAQADLGACVHAPGARPGDRAASGASYATAYVSGRLAALLDHGHAPPTALRLLLEGCRWRGAERRR